METSISLQHENHLAGDHDANHVGEKQRKGSLRHLIGESGDRVRPVQGDGACASHTGRHCNYEVGQIRYRAACDLLIDHAGAKNRREQPCGANLTDHTDQLRHRGAIRQALVGNYGSESVTQKRIH